jgi:hypothetical protein
MHFKGKHQPAKTIVLSLQRTTISCHKRNPIHQQQQFHHA